MRIKRIVNIIFFVLAFFVIVKLGVAYREISEANEYINHYLTKPINIIFEVNGKDNSLSSIWYYPRKAEYYGIFNRLSKGYEEVVNNPRVVDSDISYYLIAAKYEKEYISIIGCDDIKEEGFVNDYSFREEDIVIGNDVVIIPQGMKNNEGQEIKVGDIIVINNSLNSYAVNCEVIGFHEIEDERFYMPNKTIEKISKKWLSFESNANYSETKRFV